MTPNEIQSKCIAFLRFPLIIGVVFIHTKGSVYINGLNLCAGNYPVYQKIIALFSDVIARISVPLFFFMSGFLFFYKVNWNKSTYINKLKKRKNSLLIPYLFWNALAILIFGIMQSVLPSFASGNNVLIPHWNFTDYLRAFWAMDNYIPFVGPFWFIRNLMVVVLLTPCIYYLIKFGKYWSVILLGYLWFIEVNIPFSGLNFVSLFFFSAGAYLSINNLNIISTFKHIFPYSLFFYPVIAGCDLFTKGTDYNFIIHNIGILIGIFMCFDLVYLYCKNGNKNMNNFLTSAAFFVFAIHEPYYTQMRKIIYKVVKPDSDWQMIVLYFTSVTIMVLGALALYAILIKITPRFTQIISGGR